MNKERLVKFSDVSFEYSGKGGVTAIQNLSFEIKKGDVLAIMGENGAGKSTLCYLMSSVIPNIYGGTRRGDVEIKSFDPWDQNIYETAQHVGLLLQNPETQLLMPDLYTELTFGPSNMGIPKEEIDKRVEDVLQIVRLEKMEDRHPRELSGGQKQRAALAATLTMFPDLLIFDEPTAQLDPIGTMEVFDAIKRIRRERNISIVITTHKTEEIAKLADKVLIIQNGKKMKMGPPARVFSDSDFLEKVGIKAPDTVEYLNFLAEQGLDIPLPPPLDIESAYTIIAQLFQENKLEVASMETETEGEKGGVLIEVDNVTFDYEGPPKVRALKDINLTIRKGEFVGIIGQNGSGKSTLVQNIIGLLQPTKGTVYYRGNDVSKKSVAEMSKHIGLVLQNPDHQLFTISAENEVQFGLKREKKLDQEDIKARVREALELVGLEEKADSFPFSLSFGDRRKLTVAATIAMRPEVLIMDEPTTAQDYRGRYLLADLGKRLHRELGTTNIMITHDMDLIARYADRIIVLKDGKILMQGQTRDVFKQQDKLRDAFLKPPQITRLALQLRKHNVPGGILTPEEMKKSVVPSQKPVK